MNSLNRRLIKTIILVLMLVVMPVFYINFLKAFVFHPGLKLSPEWSDDTFNTWFEKPVWSDTTFDKEWAIAWEHGQSDNSSGFKVFNNTLILYATFKGYNSTYVNGATGIMLQENITVFDNTNCPFLVVGYKASSSSPALALSFGIVDVNGTSHYGPSYHVSSDPTYLSYDLTTMYLGKIRYLSLRFTNDFDPNFSGGLHFVYVQFITFFEKPQIWNFASSNSIKGNILGANNMLNVSMDEYISKGDIVTAQRTRDLPTGLASNNFLKISIWTSSINVAARITIWSNAFGYREILLKTYNDTEWHTEIVSLPFLDVSGNVYMIELGMIRLYPSDSVEEVSYKQLSFCNLEL